MTQVKQQMVYEEQQNYIYHKKGTNQYYLTDQQRNNINKRLPRRFSLVKLHQIPKDRIFKGQVQYVPVKRTPRVASQQLTKQFLIQPIVPNQNNIKQLGKSQIGVDKTGLRFSQLPEGKSKQGEKIKNILQRFRKHQKYTGFAQYLTRMGFMTSFLEIEAQNKKNIHTIDSFKDRMMIVFKNTKDVTYEQVQINLINQLIDQFLFHVQQARKLQFETSLGNIQKSIDKVTRQISEIKQSGNYYYRKKKRNQKNYDDKELLYIAQLMKALPFKEFVGILQIIQEKPFQEIGNPTITFDLNQLKPKKIREIEFYVKKKLSNHYKSRDRKREKLIKARNALLTQQKLALSNAQYKQADVKKQQRSEKGEQRSENKSLRKENIKDQAEIQNIFEFDDEEKKQFILPREQSLISMDEGSRNDFDDGFLQENYQSNFFMDENVSIPNPSIAQRSERNMFNQEEGVEFEEPNLLNNFRVEPQEEQIMNDESDSSMITDEEDSQY